MCGQGGPLRVAASKLGILGNRPVKSRVQRASHPFARPRTPWSFVARRTPASRLDNRISRHLPEISLTSCVTAPVCFHSSELQLIRFGGLGSPPWPGDEAAFAPRLSFMTENRHRTRGSAADILAIRKLASDWRAGWLAGDANALVSLWADDPVLLPQGHAPIKSKRAIRALYRAVFEEVEISSKSALREIVVSGDWGYFWSTYDLTAIPRTGGTPIRSKGKSVFIVARDKQGAWKIARLMDNSDDQG